MDKRILSRREKFKSPTPPAAEPAAPAEPAATPPAQDPNAAPPAAAPKPDAAPQNPKALRERLSAVEKEAREKGSRVTELEARIADYEKKGLDTTKLSERLAAREKELGDLQSQLRAMRREKSPEFVEKYDKPFNQAAEYAQAEIQQLQIEAQVDSQTGDVLAPARAAKWDDFIALYQMPKGKAIAEAKKLFGDAAGVVISHLTDLQRMDYQRKAALESERKSQEAMLKDQEAKALQQREFITQTWTRLTNEIAERNPEWYGEDPKDPEFNELLKEGYQMVDSRFSGTLTPQQQMIFDANIRARAAAFPGIAHRLTKAQNRIAELEAALAEARGSEPGKTLRPGGNADGGSGLPQTKPWKADLRETMAKGE